MAARKKSKVAKAIAALSREESDRIGMEVAIAMKTDLKFLVYSYSRSCSHLVKDTFGWEQEDLEQHMMEVLWKGLATYDESKRIKKTTYLSVIFKNSMANLIKACNRDKRRLTRLYCPEIMVEDSEQSAQLTGEDWVSYQSTFSSVIGHLSEREKKVMAYHLAYGMSISDICRKTRITKVEVVSIIKMIKDKMEVIRDTICGQ